MARQSKLKNNLLKSFSPFFHFGLKRSIFFKKIHIFLEFDFISYSRLYQSLTHSPPLFPLFTQRLRPNIIYSMTTVCLRCIHVQSCPIMSNHAPYFHPFIKMKKTIPILVLFHIQHFSTLTR